MATQSGITIAGPNEPYTVVKNIARPAPGSKQVLVKSLYVGINPVEPFMQHSGALILEFPAVLGSDAFGVVVAAGEGCTKLKTGDYVYGCVRIGQNEFSPFQETFLADEDLVFKNHGLAPEDACTVGVGYLTAALGLLAGLKLTLPAPGSKSEPKDSWVIVMGGSGNVGQCACQLARLCGYKVLASCSTSKAQLALTAGATATINSRSSIEEQLDEIKKITEGKFGRIFDASVLAFDLSIQALQTGSEESEKYFSTADDWSDMHVPASIGLDRVQLGHIGRYDEEAGKTVTAHIASWIPALEAHLASGALTPLEHQTQPGTGWEKVIEGIADFEAGKAARKIVIKVQEE